MKKLIVTVGVSGSGKTTWAEEYCRNEYGAIDTNKCNINRDNIRFALFNNGVKDWTKYKFNKANETKVTEMQDQIAQDCVAVGIDIIISDTNLNPKTRGKWRKFAADNDYEYEEKVFDVSWETLVKRNAQRLGGVSESVIWRQYKQMNDFTGNVGKYQEDPLLEDTIICDIDGSVAFMEGRSPFEWSKVGEDKPREAIIKAVIGMAQVTHHVTFLSGRDGICFDKTKAWLEKHLKGNDDNFRWELFMRAPKDSRKDSIIKDELYEKYVKGEHNVYAVLDDRRQMIRHWSLKEMPNLIDVGNYNEEF